MPNRQVLIDRAVRRFGARSLECYIQSLWHSIWLGEEIAAVKMVREFYREEVRRAAA